MLEDHIECTVEGRSWTVVETVWLILIAAISLLVVLPEAGIEPPPWLQPGLVGLIWGGQFVIGFWSGGTDRMTFFGMSVLIAASAWLSRCFQSMTDFTFYESLFLSVIVVAIGWMLARYSHTLARPHWSHLRIQQSRQFSISDLFFLMTIVACLVCGATRMSTHPLPLLGVLGTLLIGSSGCWAVIHWVWNDRHPLGIPFLIASASVLLGMTLVSWLAPSMSWWERVEWAVSGPLSVCAVQCATVLVAFAGIRQNAFFLQEHSPCSKPENSNALKVYVETHQPPSVAGGVGASVSDLAVMASQP
jgi:hypothetical protein